MKTILLHGWLAKVFIVLLWIIALTLRVTMDDDNREGVLFSLIAFSNFLFYLMVATRLPLLTHSKMAVLLPDFPSKLRNSLITLLFISLLPTLLVLPDIVTWLAFVAISIISTLIFVAMVYQPKYQIFIWLFILLPLPLDLLDIKVDKAIVFLCLAWSLPCLIVLFNRLLNKLVHYRGNPHHVSKIIATMNVTMGKTLAVQESIPFADRTKLAQWWANSHFNYYRKLISVATSNKHKLSNRKLIEISCQSANSFGINAYVIWSVGIALICLLGLALDNSYHRFFTPMVMLIPAMVIGTGSITLFQIIQCKKSYLARLAILPRFKQSNSFARAFLGYVIVNQIKLYCFIVTLLALTACVFGHLSITKYLNLVLILFVFCFLTISVMLYAWRAERDFGNQVVWLMLISFIGVIIFSIHMVSSNMSLLISNHFYQILLMSSSLLVTISGYQYLQYYSKR